MPTTESTPSHPYPDTTVTGLSYTPAGDPDPWPSVGTAMVEMIDMLESAIEQLPVAPAGDAAADASRCLRAQLAQLTEKVRADNPAAGTHICIDYFDVDASPQQVRLAEWWDGAEGVTTIAQAAIATATGRLLLTDEAMAATRSLSVEEFGQVTDRIRVAAISGENPVELAINVAFGEDDLVERAVIIARTDLIAPHAF